MRAQLHPRFGAFIMTETGRFTPRGLPMLEYALTSHTDRFEKQDVVYGDTVVGQSAEVAKACDAVRPDAINDADGWIARLKRIIVNEASGWDMAEDISQRKRLLEGSALSLENHGDSLTLHFKKPV